MYKWAGKLKTKILYVNTVWKIEIEKVVCMYKLYNLN